jgi:lipoprotein-anchoring transpeptidase ErfK/SrfK
MISCARILSAALKIGRLFRIAGFILCVLIICGCETVPEGPYPRAAEVGFWNDEGASGSPRIIVHIGEQKAYFYKGKTLIGESTVSTGKPGFSTPPGHYTVLSKDAAHVSSVFGDYVDDSGNVTRSNIDCRKDRKPPGSHFDGARMPYAMFFRGGYAMHQGYVPPFAASHGCIRLPGQMAVRFFENAPVGTPVKVTE